MIDSAIQTHLPDGWTEDQLLFYIKPFLAKWRKTFPQFRVAVVCAPSIDPEAWQKALKASEVCAVPAQTWPPKHEGYFDAVIVVDPNLSLQSLEQACQLATPYGMVLGVTRNLEREWATWHASLEQGLLERLFTVGINPRGGAAWWPFKQGQALSRLMDFFQSVLPGKAQTNLKYGRAWLFQGYRPYAQTPLTGIFCEQTQQIHR